VLVLAVDIDQQITGFAQLRRRRRMTVDETARAPRRLDHAPQQAYAFVAGEFVLRQP